MLDIVQHFPTFSTSSVKESLGFYQMLGLEAEIKRDTFLHVHGPDFTFVVYEKEDHQPSKYTVMNFMVRDIEKQVDLLTQKGVTFMQLDVPLAMDAKGISWDEEGSHIAWFKDPGGNILTLIEN